MPDDELTTPLARPEFDIVARVTRIDSRLYFMRLVRVPRQKDRAEELMGQVIFRADEWAQVVPGLRARDVVIDYGDVQI